MLDFGKRIREDRFEEVMNVFTAFTERVGSPEQASSLTIAYFLRSMAGDLDDVFKGCDSESDSEFN